MQENDEIEGVLRRLGGPAEPDDGYELAKAVRRLIVKSAIPPDRAYDAISFAVAKGHNFEIYTGNRWFDDEFKEGLEYYSKLSNRFEGVPARATLLGVYRITALITAVRDDLIASERPLEALTPFDALVEGADAGNTSCQNALVLAMTSPMTEEFTQQFISECILNKPWYRDRATLERGR